MKSFLFLIILALCGVGYFEYTVFQQQSIEAQQKIASLSQQVDDLTAAKKKLADDQQSLAEAKTQAVAQLQTLQGQFDDLQKKEAAEKARLDVLSPPVPATAAGLAGSASDPNDLGTIVTLSGRTYQQCKLLKTDADGITFSYSDGITKVIYGLLSPELQHRLGYDPQQAVKMTAAQLKYQEDLQKATQASQPPQ